MQIIKPTKKQIGERLDKMLIKIKISRNQIQKLIKGGQILVNKKIVNPNYILKKEDVITINEKNTSQNFLSHKTKSKTPKIKIIKETSDYLIVNKASGIITHGAPHIKEITLADILSKEHPSLLTVGDDRYRPGIVHRLDKEASGLMVIAKNNDFFEHIKKQFQKRLVTKKYIALVYGSLLKEAGIIDFPIERSSSGHKMAAKPKSQGGKQAVTKFKTVKKFINYTLLEIKIKTGRTHQIRCHLASIGHPIVGDNLYGTKKTKEKNKKNNLGRIFLAATELSFSDLDNEKQYCKIKIPTLLNTFLKKIK